MGGNRAESFRSGNKSLIISLTHRVQPEAVKFLMLLIVYSSRGGGDGGKTVEKVNVCVGARFYLR